MGGSSNTWRKRRSATNIAELLGAYPDADVATILIELYHLDYEDFFSDSLARGLDYSGDDALPRMCETPRNYLADLIVNAVTARLLKNYGRQLLLAWIDGAGLPD